MSLSFDKATSRMKVHVVKARNLCCKAREGKGRIDVASAVQVI